MSTVRRRLPAQPHLDVPKQEARELLRQCRLKSIDAFDRIRRRHPKFQGTDDKTIATHLKLSDAQLVIAREYNYWENNTTRFNRWAGTIGDGKAMVGVSKQYNSLSNAETAAAWEPTGGTKAGIMVFAGNVDSSYTNSIFRKVK